MGLRVLWGDGQWKIFSAGSIKGAPFLLQEGAGPICLVPRLSLPTPLPSSHLLQGVWRDFLTLAKDRAMVLDGESLEFGAKGLLLLRDNSKRSSLEQSHSKKR